jgi:hypothetical protein
LLIPCSTTTTAIDLANVTALEECDVLIQKINPVFAKTKK